MALAVMLRSIDDQDADPDTLLDEGLAKLGTGRTS
jgi:hypothetical protein